MKPLNPIIQDYTAKIGKFLASLCMDNKDIEGILLIVLI